MLINDQEPVLGYVNFCCDYGVTVIISTGNDKKREVKTRDDVVNLARDAQACLGECSGYSGEPTEPRVISS